MIRETDTMTSDQSAPPAGRKNIIMNVCIFILIMEGAERLCFYTFSGSINIFMRNELDFPQAQSSSLLAVFNTLVYLTPLLGGYIADASWGRYKTIGVFGTLYLIGVALMTLSSYPPDKTEWLFMISFFGCIALGAGGIKSNVVTMGGDQFNLDIPEEIEQKERYFNYFYWVINIGALVSYFVLAQMATEPEEFGLWPGWGFFATFGISTGALLLALTSFFAASGRYIYKPPSGSATAKIFAVIFDAAREKGMGKLLLTGTAVVFLGVIVGVVQAFLLPGPAQDGMTYAAFACAVIGIACVLIPTTGMPTWLDPHAREGYSLINADQMQQHDSTEHRVMMATRVVSVLFNTVSFQVVYAAMSFFALSACQMDVDIGGGVQINATMLNAADCIAIIVVVPLLDSYIYPWFTAKLGRKIKATEKYMCGIVLSVAAIVVAAQLEIARKHAPFLAACPDDDFEPAPLAPTAAPTGTMDDKFYSDNSGCYSQCAAVGVKMSDFSVWWMAIPFFLVGTAECLCNIPMYDLCYTQMPPAYRSLAQAVFLFMTAVGNMLTGAFITALAEYITDDLNDGHLEYFYYLCVAFVLLFIPINLYCFSQFTEFDDKIIEDMQDRDGGVDSLLDNEVEGAGMDPMVRESRSRTSSNGRLSTGRKSADMPRYSFH